MHVTDATDRQCNAVAAMLGRAFHNDPVTTWIEPDADKRAKMLPLAFADSFRDDAGGMRLVAENGSAATLWRSPSHEEPGGLWRQLRELIGMAFLSRAMATRIRHLQAALEAHRAGADQWYLHVAGCDPARQGNGLGAAVVRAGLDRIGSAPAFLETANEANLGFYRALGFRVTEEWRVADGPNFWTMIR